MHNDRFSLSELFPSAAWLPQKFDATHRWVRLVKFDEQSYRDAPFLDDRGRDESLPHAVVSWTDIAQAIPAKARKDGHYLFHMGRVGSTLLSRLLAECGSVLPVREPLLLMEPLARRRGQSGPSIRDLRALFARTFLPGQRAMIKATSLVSEIAADLCGPKSGGSHAALIAMPAHRYMAARLANPKTDQQRRGAERFARLKTRAPDLSTNDVRTPARLAAMSWAAEATSLEVAAKALGNRATFVDFDSFLDAPDHSLAELASHFGLSPSPERISAIVRGPLMERYAKRTSRTYSLQDRENSIRESADCNRADIADAMAWLHDLASTSPSVAAALDLFGG